MIYRMTLAGVLLALAATSAFGQVAPHRCEVSVTNFNTDTRKTIGSFTTVVQQDKSVTKSFPFPGTKLVVTASTQYEQSIEGEAQMILMVILGKRAYPEIGEGLKGSDVKANARATVPLKSFERARVETIFLEERQPVIIGIECK